MQACVVDVRMAVGGDVEQVVSLWAYAAGPTRIAGDAGAVIRLLARDPEALLVAEARGRIVGTLVVGWDGWRCHLYRMAVEPDRRRTGIASALLDAAVERAQTLGAVR